MNRMIYGSSWVMAELESGSSGLVLISDGFGRVYMVKRYTIGPESGQNGRARLILLAIPRIQ